MSTSLCPILANTMSGSVPNLEVDRNIRLLLELRKWPEPGGMVGKP